MSRMDQLRFDVSIRSEQHYASGERLRGAFLLTFFGLLEAFGEESAAVQQRILQAVFKQSDLDIDTLDAMAGASLELQELLAATKTKRASA